ncbi:solute carrier organic anion transporter family member 4A1-like [Montipora capricornis]|uniref:solute carrier organic anion transporter family member 4A1-like n=1 Tax=Montipora capricornis TaxID=246305 RepID=UPI0035F18CDC
MDKQDQHELHYGWFSFKPKWLQIMNNSKCFLFISLLIAALQGMTVNGMTGINLPALEKRFQLTSKDLGLITASNDISAILLISFVSFYGQFGNKIKWIGHGAIVTAIGFFVFVLPHVIVGPYQPLLKDTATSSSRSLQECVVTNSTSTTDACFSGYESNWLSLALLCLGQLLMGAGTTPLYSLAPAYIDENVHPRASPVYLGIFYAAAITGPGLGFIAGGAILNDFYIQIKQPSGANLTSRDPQWIGAWWLGYIVTGAIMFLIAILLLGFPRELPGSAEMRARAIKEGQLPKEDQKIKGKWKDIIPATTLLIKNPTFLFNSLAITAHSLYGAAVSAFLAKFAQVKFAVNPAVNGISLGAVFLVAASGGIVLSGFLVRRLNLKKSCKLSAKWCVIISIFSVWTALAFIIPGCDEVNLAGVVKPYHNSSLPSPRSPVASCNVNCRCSLANINPICGQDKLTYFSPCHAGCETIKGSQAFNCSCIHTGMSNDTQGTAKKGFCDRGSGCKFYYLFVAVVFLLLVISFLNAMPNKTVILRCVPHNQRSYSLGFQFIFQRSLGLLPGPVLLGWMFDVNCLFWGKSCGKRGRCQIYDIWKLSLIITLFGCFMKALNVLFYFISYWYCKSSYDDDQTNTTAEVEQGTINEDLDQKSLESQL